LAERWRAEALGDNRAAALSAAVALVTAHLHDVSVDRDLLAAGLTDRQVADAAVWLARLLAEHALLDTGPLMLRVVGQTAGWVSS
jgi:alkylhydroperoxidase family enzyme